MTNVPPAELTTSSNVSLSNDPAGNTDNGPVLDGSDLAAFTDQLDKVAGAGGFQGALPAEDSLYYDAASMAPLNALSAVCSPSSSLHPSLHPSLPSAHVVIDKKPRPFKHR